MRLSDGAAGFGIEREGGRVRVTANLPWASAGFLADLHPGEASAFADALDALHRDGAGAATFEARENWGRIVAVASKKGELHLTVTLQQPPDYLHELTVVLALRQDDLPRLARDLRALDE